LRSCSEVLERISLCGISRGPDRDTFAETPYPGDESLVRSAGDEPDDIVAAEPLLRRRFRFYLPVYLMWDLDGALVDTAPTAAIVAYLRFKAAGDLGGFARQGVEEALGSCWLSETG
jgi:hypothetical protein